MNNTSQNTSKIFLLAALGVISFLSLFFLDPIRQDPEYHNFADSRTVFGIANYFDVISNIPFLIVGIFGILISNRRTSQMIRPAWHLCFAGVAMVSFGSAYYHLNPDSDTLIWDRLPMAIGFMGLFSALFGEYVNEKAGIWILIPALAVGLSSIHYWQIHDDLRFYVWVQAVPVLIIPVLLLMFKSKYSRQYLLLAGFFLYALAKVFELFDDRIFALTGELIGGHAVKHLLAALAVYSIVLMLKKREKLRD